MQIGTNPIAQTAVRAIHAANAAVATASERISTGLRVNRASDDPAAMVQGNWLKTQITSASRVIDNLNQGVAMTQIVDNSLSQMVTVLGKMGDIASLATKSTTTYAEYVAYQDAMDGYIAEIKRIATAAVWNDQQLMSESLGYSPTLQADPNSADSSANIPITFRYMDDSVVFADSTMVDPSLTSSSKYTSITSTINVSSPTAANRATGYITKALDVVSSYQAYIGAMANVLTAQSDVISSYSTTYSSAYGNVMNADLAQETTNLATAQIQRDGATAMLAQANGMNKEIVSLLLKSVTQ